MGLRRDLPAGELNLEMGFQEDGVREGEAFRGEQDVP